MANVYATKSGNWSDTTVWNTGALPTASDDVYSNTFTVTIDISPTVLTIRNTSATSIAVGGQFVPANGITLTCTASSAIITGTTGTSGIQPFESKLLVNQSCTIVGNIAGDTVIQDRIPIRNGAGTLNIVGNVAGGTSYSWGILNVNSAATINITGTVSGKEAVYFAAGGTLNVTGNIVSNGSDASVYTASTLNTVSVIGSVTAGTAPGINLRGAGGNMTVIGTLTASPTAPAVQALSTAATTILSGPFLVATNGLHAVFSPNWKWANSSVSPTYYQIRTANLATIRPLYTADSVGGNPAITNVRSGTVYGPSSELTGTCAVPAAASVVAGVPVDNTVGTAAITAATIRAAMGLASANLDTQLSGIDTNVSTRSTFNPATDAVANVTLVDTTTNLTNPPDVPTTAEIATAVANELEPTLTSLDNDVLSRLAAVDYTTPPTAQQNAEAVEVQLAFPLGNMDIAISTRSTFNPATDTVANVTLVDTTTNLTNPPVVPTTSEIATAVADTLDPTLTQIDNDILSRLATADYITPPTAEQNAEAVRVELSPELDRVANCATVATTGQQIQDALTPNP